MLAAKREQGAPEPAKKKRRMGGSTATNEPSKEDKDKDSLVLWRANREEFNKRQRCKFSAPPRMANEAAEPPVSPVIIGNTYNVASHAR